MLTNDEKRQLNYDKLSPELRLKIDTAFESPDFIVAYTYAKQIHALAHEMIDNPFTIRGDSKQLEVTEDGIKDAIKEAVTARQNTETALKVLNQLDELGEKLKSIQQNLSTEENNMLNKKIVTAKDLRGQAFGAK